MKDDVALTWFARLCAFFFLWMLGKPVLLEVRGTRPLCACWATGGIAGSLSSITIGLAALVPVLLTLTLGVGDCSRIPFF